MIDLSDVTACLISKDPVYPLEVLAHVSSFPFGEILVLTYSDSPHRKHELFAKAKFDTIYYNDDDAICPIRELLEVSDTNEITLAQKPSHQEAYKDLPYAVGFGWGCFFPKHILGSLKRYTDVYGEDEVYKRETERILMCFNPHKRLVLPITDLPSAYAPDRLWRQPQHQNFAQIAGQRCQEIIRNQTQV